MPRLTTFERIRVIKLFNDLPYKCYKNIIEFLSKLNKQYSIDISESGVRRLVDKWCNTKSDLRKKNKHKCLIFRYLERDLSHQ